MIFLMHLHRNDNGFLMVNLSFLFQKRKHNDNTVYFKKKKFTTYNKFKKYIVHTDYPITFKYKDQ